MERSFKIRVNGELHGTPRVRVIAADGEMLGIMTLAEVNPKAEPPICKILDFSEYKDKPAPDLPKPDGDDD